MSREYTETGWRSGIQKNLKRIFYEIPETETKYLLSDGEIQNNFSFYEDLMLVFFVYSVVYFLT